MTFTIEDYNQLGDRLTKFKSSVADALLSAGYITGIILGIIGFFLLIVELDTFRKVRDINYWKVKKNVGKILENYMESSSVSINLNALILSSNHVNLKYRNRVSFEYEINGEKYISYKYSFYEPWSDNPIIPKMEGKFFPPEEIVDVLINPNDPSEAYIANKPYTNYNRITIAIILSTIGIYIVMKSS
uniref:DUF3592 domain-containing protein n=1 Tax=viral metagenome TaxID=1070528 RepID=A0A6C0LSI3_9ZZZZ